MKTNSIQIKNFGPIKEADINITPLTIFIGQNSSGKSFSALLIHSLLNTFDKLGFNQYNKVRNESVQLFLQNNNEEFRQFKYLLNKYVESQPKLSDDPFKFPTDKLKIILEESFGQVLKDLVEEKIKGNFNNKLKKLNRLNRFPFEFVFNNSVFTNQKGNLVLEKYNVNIDNVKNESLFRDEDRICSFKIDDEYISINLDYILWNNFFDRDNFFSETIFMMIVSAVMDTFKQSSYYLPAAGDEILKDVHNYVSQDINGRLNPSTVEKELLTNFLKSKDLNPGPFYGLADELEHEILGGKLEFKKGEIKEKLLFIDEENEMELELNLTSSSIRELMPLIIYLKYFLKHEDTLIIEEPENHIHPKNQLILVKYLVKAINQGLNIIITTHSEYIVEKFNNFIRLGNAKKEIFSQIGYDESNILDYKCVNVYNFKNEGKYTYVAESLDINETGFDENSFYEVNTELYEESSDIIDARRSD